ncbi:hypothetical protein [Anaerotignum propionicum]|uniref:Uncharacterized protein n=1 Tax=Anaerotignum propionicum DSM 1682 TaxID=991789 RepID=A0A0X8V967_ANAPI|nr:hypothetical protein [Anaerotignum propionicum]AMJ40387.1 hypothetical protein CPRO_07860 [Anaerotignum propionicum DSM 1682]SHE43463.1 hypothetical protein SAMN02745151_00694 [[Clostridium] propionicum DSM 1682] [Anaerotignum propionicum DSM 1682]
MEWENVVAGQKADPKQINKIGNQVAKYKGLRLAAQVIVPDGSVQPTIEIDKYTDGSPLHSELGGELLCYSGENANITTALGYLQINGITAPDYWGTVAQPAGAFSFGYWGNVSTEVFGSIRVLNKNVIVKVQSTARYELGGAMKMYGGGLTTPQTAVTAIKLFLSTGTFSAGTVVEWWERG